jgi:hypothetical protein
MTRSHKAIFASYIFKAAASGKAANLVAHPGTGVAIIAVTEGWIAVWSAMLTQHPIAPIATSDDHSAGADRHFVEGGKRETRSPG